MALFDVTTHREGGTLRIAGEGELDIAAAESLRAALAERSGFGTLVVDLRGLTFLDTSGIQVVVETFRAAREEGFELRILRAPPQVQRVFAIAGLEEVLPFDDGEPGG